MMHTFLLFSRRACGCRDLRLIHPSGAPIYSKTFYKADRAQIKWNDLSTQVFVLTQTEVDNSNMSYYGKTGMYLLSAAGNFDYRLTLDNEGPIHDVSWSLNSKEFGVVWDVSYLLRSRKRFVSYMPP
ncbi:eukaryotic translation initiation factor eIF2A-domain-containing protein [Suillus spraguei]|nr:eukaryotic translation initiation factor eIF2A-domain-containing protein [Suillus spraguei]